MNKDVKINKGDLKVNLKMHTLPAFWLMEVELPAFMISDLNHYLDNLLEKEDRIDHSSDLVGQIHTGQQLTMDSKDDRVKKFSYLVCQLGHKYISHFKQVTGTNKLYPEAMSVSVDSMWSVHSYAGDYNPLHDHGCDTLTGVAATTWTKIPEQIAKQPDPNEAGYTLFNSSGNSDGYIMFNYGNSSSMDASILKPPMSVTLKPKVGRLYIFPIWLQHTVYPFKGEGERRTIALNMNAWHVEKEEKELLINKIVKHEQPLTFKDKPKVENK